MLDSVSATAFAPLLLAIAIPFLGFSVLGTGSPSARLLASVTSVMFGLRYVWWRWTWSMPTGQDTVQQGWAWFFLAFETLSVVSSLSVYLFMSRKRDRSSVVDARRGSPMLGQPVDVFIATYNEPREILERTIVGATNIDHPDLRVWVLDDGARPWVKDLAESLGALYRHRLRGAHAKAGNVNNGLREALSTGRRPAFMLLLDADFVPARRILKRTLPLFEDIDVGIVQTPQHFFNPDPIQANLLCSSVWPDEQRFFFNHFLASKDAWGAAFCCGTSALFRLDALEACGGMPTATVTEDMLTSFRMLEFGYRTIFLNEQLSLGLAPEGLNEYVTQRTRWCLGSIQQIRTRWSFAGSARVGLINRLSALDGVLFWIASFAFKLMMISAPMVYWWTGTAVIDSSLTDILVWLAPYFASGMVFMAFMAGNTVFPVMSDVTHLLAAPAIVRTVATGLIKPWGHPFKVTAKGLSTTKVTVQWSLLAPFAAIAIATLIGMVINMSPYSSLNGTSGYDVNVIWSVFNIAILSIACAVCVELPKRRRDERFSSKERAKVTFPGAAAVECDMLDVSLGGAQLSCGAGWDAIANHGELAFESDGSSIPFKTLRFAERNVLSIAFDQNDETRRFLTRKLFTGNYNNEVETVSISGIIVNVTRAVFR